jgi:TRAP-type C4-dicarboxylate transport system substrate-binding protein
MTVKIPMTNFRLKTILTLAALLLSGSVFATVLKIATLAPEGSEWMLEHRAAAAQIKELTEGRVMLKFYGGGVMGNDKKVLRKMRIGQLQGAAFSTSGLMERYFDIVLYGLPFIFESQDEVDFVRQRFDERLASGLHDAGFVSFGFAGGGFAQFMSAQPVRNQQDLATRKIWVPDGDTISFTALEYQNLSPVVLPLSDVLTGLQAGLVDVIVTPPSVALLLQWYTKVNYINPLPVSYTMGILALDNKAFDRISPADQAVVSEILTATYGRLDEINRRDNLEAVDALQANGLQVVAAESEAIPYWRGVAVKINSQMWSKQSVDKELLAEFLATLAEFRAGGEAVAAAAGE